MLLAARNWPSAFDWYVTCILIGGLLAIAVSGHVLIVLDVRAWIRSLRRALIVVTDQLPHFPRWARLQSPRCLTSLGVKLPCTEEQLLAAYRQKVKQLHPDRGGDRKRFMRMQADFEEALDLIRRTA